MFIKLKDGKKESKWNSCFQHNTRKQIMKQKPEIILKMNRKYNEMESLKSSGIVTIKPENSYITK